MKPSLIVRLVTFSVQRAWLVIAIALVLAGAAGWFAAGHFNMTTDTEQLISASLPWRQNGLKFDEAFPQGSDTICAVVDGKTPELADHGAAVLADKVAQNKALILWVDRPDGGPFWDREGLLLLLSHEGGDEDTTAQLIKAQPGAATPWPPTPACAG